MRLKVYQQDRAIPLWIRPLLKNFYAGLFTMPKLKTKRSAAKRFKKTGSGKFMFNKPGHSHILTKKTRKRKRNMKKDKVISETMITHIKRMLPYA